MRTRMGDPGIVTRALSYPQVVAHRGASAALAEHTLAAYEGALEQGAEALECDVRLTADGHLVCVHDSRIDRTSDGRGRVSNKTLQQLQEHDFASWWGDGGEVDVPVLTLDELLEFALEAPSTPDLAIETKHPTRFGGFTEQSLVRTLDRFGLLHPRRGRSRVRVMSFSAIALRRMRDLAPQIPTVYLMDRVPVLTRPGRLPFGSRLAGIDVRIVEADPESVRGWQAAGNQIHAWTVDTAADLELCMRAGVTAVMTNRPGDVVRWRSQIRQSKSMTARAKRGSLNPAPHS